MKINVLLQLGRISNSPTVISNLVASAVIAGGIADIKLFGICVLATLLVYVGGMFLNDALDVEYDKIYKPASPIPSGKISQKLVLVIAAAMLLLAICLYFTVSLNAGMMGIVLVFLVVLYDLKHKNNRFSPWVMGACRVAVYLIGGITVANQFDSNVIIFAVGMWFYIAGLTLLAQQEDLNKIHSLWPLLLLLVPIGILLQQCILQPFGFVFLILFIIWLVFYLSRLICTQGFPVGRVVAAMIAGISLYDATMASVSGKLLPALVCVIMFGLALFLQRYIRAT